MIKMNLTLTINNKTKALMKIVTLITMIIRFDNKLLIKSSLQLLMWWYNDKVVFRKGKEE